MFQFEKLDHKFAAIIKNILGEGVFLAINPQVGNT